MYENIIASLAVSPRSSGDFSTVVLHLTPVSKKVFLFLFYRDGDDTAFGCSPHSFDDM